MSPNLVYLGTIGTQWRCGILGIFQAKVNDILIYIEGIQKNIKIY